MSEYFVQEQRTTGTAQHYERFGTLLAASRFAHRIAATADDDVVAVLVKRDWADYIAERIDCR